MEDKDWLKGLENKLKDYEEPAPEGLWEGIESSISSVEKRRVVALPWLWRSVAAAAVVALGVFAGLRLHGLGDDVKLNESQEALASGEPSSVINDGSRGTPVEIVPNPVSETLLAESGPVKRHKSLNDEVLPIMKKAVSEKMPASEAGDEEMNILSSESEAIPNPESENVPVSESDDIPAALEKAATMSKKEKVSTDYDGQDWSEYLSTTSDPHPSRRKASSLDVSFSGGAMDSRREDVYDLQMFYRGSAPASAPGLTVDGLGGGPGGDANVQTKALAPMSPRNSTSVVSKSDHRRPVRFALTANYPISGTFGLESGLTFTTLRSSFSTEAGRTLTETDQTLMYIGVPLNMTASILDTKVFSLYAGVGGMVEKSVSGKTVTTETVGGVKQGDSVKKSLNVKPLMLSLNASAGLQANLTRNLGVYVEPGLSYHFDDGSGVSTIYKDRPLDFAVTIGARFSFR